MIDALNQRWAREYDIVGRLTAHADPLGRRSTMIYDVLNRMISSTDTNNAVKKYDYDPNHG